MSPDKLASTSCGATKRSSGLFFCFVLIVAYQHRWAEGIFYAFWHHVVFPRYCTIASLALPVSDCHFSAAAAVELLQ
jgi:hypothetical protein